MAGTAWLRIAVALIAVMSAVAFAACGDDDSSSGDEATAATGDETVSVESVGDAGDVLVDASGATLYTPDQESSGKIECKTADCTSIWMPVTVAGGDDPTGSTEIEGDLGTVKRPDGDTQVSFDGMPLYSFTEEGPGEVTGDGFEDTFDGTDFTWHVVTPTGASSSDDTSSSDSDPGYSY
jgi:predicted lipoprotein with Yx(FWY)xxD motif